MTTSTQFQQAGAFSTYYNIGADGLYVGTDVDNSNNNGSLCVIPFYKRGFALVNGYVATKVFTIPGNCQVILLKLENPTGASYASTSVFLTGRNSSGVTVNLMYNTSFSFLSARSAQYPFSSDTSSAGDYCVPDVGLTYSTVTFTLNFPTFTGAPSPPATGTPINFTIGFIPAAINTTPGQ